jgi:hypothetical protein
MVVVLIIEMIHIVVIEIIRYKVKVVVGHILVNGVTIVDVLQIGDRHINIDQMDVLVY